MMPLDRVADGMNIYEVADALRLAPFSHPDVWQKRTDELRRQGRDVEAEWVEATFPDQFTDTRRREVEATARAVERMFDRLSREEQR